MCACSKILLVDDDGFNVLVLSEIIENQQIKYDKAYSGDEALNKIK